MASSNVTSSTIGFPRIGPNREMKKALEAFWSGKSTPEELIRVAEEVEKQAWTAQKDAGISLIGLDSTLYDQVLDFTTYLGLIPARFEAVEPGLARYFAMARGVPGAPALDMQKYFDTNYHYLVPELESPLQIKPDWSALLAKVRRGQALVGAAAAVPILLGPVTLVALSRLPEGADAAALVSQLVPAYVDLLTQLRELGVPEVQVHEPVLSSGTASDLLDSVKATVTALAAAGVSLNLVIYYDDLEDVVYKEIIGLPVTAISLDFCGVPGAAHGCGTASLIAKHGFPKDKRLGAGIIDGRSIWKDDGTAATILASLRAALGADQPISVQSSTTLQHVPYDVSVETGLAPELVSRVAFALQKLQEMVSLASGASDSATATDLVSLGAPYTATQSALPGVEESMYSRSVPYAARRSKQPSFPPFPTTSIGSFPQTPAIRRARLQYKRGTLSEESYRERIGAEIGYVIGVQEALGFDVLVHGEPERSDMVEYFGLKLDGYAFTEHGWVQSYGSRYVRPPIIAGDVSRAAPMTVHEYELAQALTQRPVKGMLTGPVTMLNWSFPRKDIPRSAQAFQIALALRLEVADLELAGCSIVQVDEPALREGLPLKPARWEAYLDWAVRAFRLSVAGAAPSTQIVTHLCYSSFEDILPAIDAMDADVLTIENSRSDNEMIRALANAGYARDVGPGVYDVHSPVVPTVEFLADKLRSFGATGILNGDATRIWANPDCGLKTRKWEEVLPALSNMVEAAGIVREEALRGEWAKPVSEQPEPQKSSPKASCACHHA